MAVTPAEPHFVQCCKGPVFVGSGSGLFVCACGHTLIQDYDPARFLAVALQCGQCEAVSATPPLPPGAPPPFAVVIAEAVAEPRRMTTTLPQSAFVVGRAEMDRITALYKPATPRESVYRFTPALLDAAEAEHERHVGAGLPQVPTDLAKPFEGMPGHALSWAIGHLRVRMRSDSWACLDGAPTAAACCHVAGFLHFVATWAHHPLFPAMAGTAADRGFSLHGLAPFAAAHCLTMQGNRISFPPETGSGRIERFNLATGPAETIAVLTDVFDRFEYPFGLSWTEAGLHAAVLERISAAQGHINMRNPGLLLLSPGTALGGFDEALIRAVQTAMQAVGRKNRGLMAVTPLVLRVLPAAQPHAVQFGYGFFPVANRHYRGETLMQAGRENIAV